MPAQRLYLGWDVGGWNCDKNPASRDALVLLDAERKPVGTPWRGNLRDCLNTAHSTHDLLERLLGLCGVQARGEERVVMAIDTPLALPDGLLALCRGEPVAYLGDSQANPYLYRETERWLFARGVTPLSPIKDMIGSQATKGMHFLARFAPIIQACGQWSSDCQRLMAVEGYPSPARRSARITQLGEAHPLAPPWQPAGGTSQASLTPRQLDVRDARLCALVAWCLDHAEDVLAWPPASIPDSEGWIFVPGDALEVP